MKKFSVKVNNVSYEVTVEETSTEKNISINSNKKSLEELSKIVSKTQAKKHNNGGNFAVKAPLPGIISELFVNQGESIKKGEKLLTLEAMKMENLILSPVDGVISKIGFNLGSSVMTGDLLLEITLS